jgi:hypothetical protein
MTSLPDRPGRMGKSSSGCPACDTISRLGWIGPRAPSHCRRCHRSWTAKAQAQCVACCRHFATTKAAALHQRTARDGSAVCRDPGEVRKRDGSAGLVARQDEHGTTWCLPVDVARIAALRQRRSVR